MRNLAKTIFTCENGKPYCRLGHHELDYYIYDDPPKFSADNEKIKTRLEGDLNACAIFGKSLLNDNLEQVLRTKATKNMLQAIHVVFKDPAFVNKHASRCSFYLVSITSIKSVLS